MNYLFANLIVVWLYLSLDAFHHIPSKTKLGIDKSMEHALHAKPGFSSYKNTMLSNGPRREKTWFRGFANNTGTDQSAYPRSLISALVIRY